MSVSEHAGQLPETADLVDVDALIGAYFDERPDPAQAGPARRVRHLRPPRHLDGTDVHRGPRARHQRGDVPPPQRARASTGRCSSRATRTRSPSRRSTPRRGVLRARGRRHASTPTTATRRRPRSRTRSSPTTAPTTATADGIVLTPSHNPPEDGGFKYNPPSGGPADTDVTGWIEDEANALLENDLRDVKRARAAHAARTTTCRPTSTTCPRHRPRRDPRQRAAHRRRPAGRRERRLLRRDRRAPRARPDDRQRRGRPDLPLRPARPRRQDPHGLLVAVRDGRAARAARPLRRRRRLRPRRRPPRDRHAERRAAEPQPLPRGGDRLPVRRRARLAGEPASARRSSRAR